MDADEGDRMPEEELIGQMSYVALSLTLSLCAKT